MQIFEAVPRHPRAADDVYYRLRAAILTKQLGPGAKLNVPGLADELGFSRSPVREAVQRLVQEGLAAEAPHRGAAVATLSHSDLLSLYELREVLEGLAARLACERASVEELDALDSIVADHAQALKQEDYQRHIELDMQFHAGIRAAARNEYLVASLERVQDMIAIAMLSADLAWPTLAVDEHRTILAALRSARPNEAQAAASSHVERVRRDLARLSCGSSTAMVR